MMQTRQVAVGLMMVAVVVGTSRAQIPLLPEVPAEHENPIVLSASVAVEATDNRDSVSRDKKSNVDTYLAPRIDLILRDERSRFTLQYIPSLRLRSRAADWQNDEEVYHSLGLSATRAVDARLRLRINNQLDYTDDPSIESGGVTLRGDRSYLANRLTLRANYDILQSSNLDLRLLNRIKRYDERAIANMNDEDETSLSLTARHQWQETVRLMGYAKAMKYTYKSGDLDRDFDSAIVAAGIEKALSETLFAAFMAGWQGRNYSDDSLSAGAFPYAQATLRGRTGHMRMVGEITHGVRDADIYPFSSQEYIDLRGSLVIEVSSRLNLRVGAAYSTASYDEKQIPEGLEDDAFASGDRNQFVVEAGLQHRITDHLSMDVAQRFEDVDSDVDESFSKSITRLTLTAWF